MTMDIERRGRSWRTGLADGLSWIMASIARHCRAIGEARRVAQFERDLAGLSDHMRRDLGLPPMPMAKPGHTECRYH
jgi:hypothetical protein